MLCVLGVVSIIAVVDLVVAVVFYRGRTTGLTDTLIGISVLTALIMAAGTAFKMFSLRAGGSVVARSVGAVAVDPSTTDPRLRRFVNVVEEMSIASGVPVPRLFVLEQEAGINAFAAGYSPSDAAMTVTAGALDRLNRDELQGVIGHEFSHILNGDMRINIRLIGLLFGILLLGIVGLRFLQFGGGRSRDSRNNGGNVLAIVALVFIVVGFVGQFFAGLIKAAVSRQREWLADASSVQFTRQSSGLAGALKKIAGLPEGSQLADSAGEKQISHMLFGEGRRGLSQLAATHPPLLERIQALEPGFSAEQAAQLTTAFAAHRPDGMAEDLALGLVPAGAAAARPTPSSMPAGAPTRWAGTVVPEAVSARVGSVTPDDLIAAGALSASIPADVRRLAAQQSTAVPMILALLLDARPDVRERQLGIVREQLGPSAAEAATALVGAVGSVPVHARLPLVDLATPQLTARTARERDTLLATLDGLARADGVISVFEYCLTRLVAQHLLDVADPVARSRRGTATVTVTSMRDAALSLLAAVADAGHTDAAAAGRAFTAAVARLLPGATVPYIPPGDPWRALDADWPTLRELDGRNKQVLVEALVAAVSEDGALTADEAELLRTACRLIGCPLPPFVA